jgi:hypothetical protein
LTVFNRSNDFVWGLAGANAVQFSFLLEYLAGRIGVQPGTYTQVTTNAHVYCNRLPKELPTNLASPYPTHTPIGTDWDHWDEDLKKFFAWVEDGVVMPLGTHPALHCANDWFRLTAGTFYQAHFKWKLGKRQEAYEYLAKSNAAPDWKEAGLRWFERRLMCDHLPKNKPEVLQWKL